MDSALFIRYLSSKRSVDDRALNRRVWDQMVSRAKAGPRVLEIGGGIGTMIERVVEEDRLHPRSWTMIDADPTLVAEAGRRVGTAVPFPVDLVAEGLEPFLHSTPAPFDLVIASAFLDLVDAARILPRMAPLCVPSGLFLFSITFDGLTALEPEIDPDLDRRIVELYHRTMDERVTDGARSGDSRSGRHLLTLLPRSGYRIVAAGSSDWIVHPTDGAYHADERYFLSCILGFFEQSISARPEMDRKELDYWLRLRRDQLARAELVFLAHHLDVLAARP